MDVLIVGAGAMGTWLGHATDASVTFADVDPDAAATAADAVGAGADTTTLGARDGYDVVAIAVPMTHVVDAIADQADRAERAIVDVSGVMGPPLEAMADNGPGLERASLHPLFAPDRAPGSIAVVRDETGPATEALLEDLTARGNDLIETTVTEHDDAMETVQAATHAAVLSFALAANEVPDGFETPIYDGLRTLVEQMTEGTPRVYTDIQETFAGAESVADAAATVADADREELESLYREAAEQWQPGREAGETGETGETETTADATQTETTDDATRNDTNGDDT